MALVGKDATVPVLTAVVAGAPDLERDAGGVLVVLLGGAVWTGTVSAPALEAIKGTRLGVAFTLQFAVYGHDHRVNGCVTNCVTITTDDHGFPWILGDA
jgi:hypothetical protein